VVLNVEPQIGVVERVAGTDQFSVAGAKQCGVGRVKPLAGAAAGAGFVMVQHRLAILQDAVAEGAQAQA